jgi:hypothetical protein
MSAKKNKNASSGLLGLCIYFFLKVRWVNTGFIGFVGSTFYAEL